MHVCVVCVYTHTHTHTYIYMYMHIVYMYMCIYVYMYIICVFCGVFLCIRTHSIVDYNKSGFDTRGGLKAFPPTLYDGGGGGWTPTDRWRALAKVVGVGRIALRMPNVHARDVAYIFLASYWRRKTADLKKVRMFCGRRKESSTWAANIFKGHCYH